MSDSSNMNANRNNADADANGANPAFESFWPNIASKLCLVEDWDIPDLTCTISYSSKLLFPGIPEHDEAIKNPYSRDAQEGDPEEAQQISLRPRLWLPVCRPLGLRDHAPTSSQPGHCPALPDLPRAYVHA